MRNSKYRLVSIFQKLGWAYFQNLIENLENHPKFYTRVKTIPILAKMNLQISNYWHDMHLYSSHEIFPKIDIFHCWFHYVQDESEFRKSFCVMSAFRPRGVFWKVEMTTGNEKVFLFNWIQQVFANLSWRIKDFSQCSQFFLSSKQAWLG